MRRRKGIFFVDALVGLGLLTAAALVLVAGRSAVARANQAGEDRRAAVRLAEAYLNGDASATTQPAIVVSVLPTAAPAGWRWVSVRAEVNGRAGELVGLVRGRP